MFEILEIMRSTTGKKLFIRVGRIFAFQGGFQHGCQTFIRALLQIFDRPVTEDIVRVAHFFM